MTEGPVGFGEWYRAEHAGLLGSVALAAGNFELGQDLVAEAFARAYERWDRVGAMASPTGWTYRVALNLLRRHWRRRRVETDLLRRRRISPAAPPEGADLDLWNAVGQLPPRQREAIAGRYLAGLTEAELAEAMGVTEGAASATLAQARRRLAHMLSDTHRPHAEYLP